MSIAERKHKAVLLIGPTASGKTPLGRLLEKKGLWDRRCIHFDFGANLRGIADSKGLTPTFSEENLEVIESVLDSGALLEDEHFHIAAKILHSFIERKNIRPDNLLVLNGLPRHTGQAQALDSMLKVEMVVNLRCGPEVILNRIQTNIEGDRTERIDDSLKEVENKLKIFSERTAPLLEYYRAQGVKIEQIDIKSTAEAEDIRQILNRKK